MIKLIILKKKVSSIRQSRNLNFLKKLNKTYKNYLKEKLDINVEKFFEYIAKATKAREYAKFVFSKNVSEALECIEKFGKKNNLRDELSHLLQFFLIFKLKIFL